MHKILRPIAKVLLPLMAFLTVALYSQAACADVGSSMDNYFDDSLGTVNVTGANAFKGQQYNYYTMGSLNYRAPQTTTSLGSIKLPSVRAGCGGIDIFGGGFSFINSDQLVSMLKSIASNAVGLLFQMAVDSLSELLGTNIKTFMAELTKATSRNLESCHAATDMIKSVVDSMSSASLKDCINIGLSNGRYSDYAAAFAACGAGGQANSTINSGANSSADGTYTNHNLAWEALKKHPLFKNDTELSELMMTLTGTAIISYKNASGSNDGAEVNILSGEAADQSMISALMDGGTINVYNCADTTQCLSVDGARKKITIPANKALRQLVVDKLNSIVTHIQTRTALSDDEKAFVAMSPLPIYKFASLEVAHNRLMAQTNLQQYADYLAAEIAIAWISQNLHEVTAGANTLVQVPEETMTNWKQNVTALQGALVAREGVIQQKLASAESVIGHYQTLEEEIYKNAGSRLTDSLGFVDGLKSGG